MQALRRLILNEPVVMYRKRDGSAVALEDRCAHRQAPLSKGQVRGDNIQCPYHGMRYGPDGKCVLIPSQDSVPDTARVKAYPVVERHKWIWIWIGDPALADPDLIEDFHWRDDPGWQSKGELLPLKANYRLLVENLCDLTHVPFIHPTSLNETMIDRNEQAPVKTTRDGSSVTVERWEFDQPAPSYFRAMAGMKRADRVDRWLNLVYTPASFVRLDIGAAPAGQGAQDGDRSAFPTVRNMNAITPETDKTTHYFWAQAHDFRTDEPWITDLLVANVHEAFLEDLEIIALQQENIDSGTTPPVITPSTSGVVWLSFSVISSAMRSTPRAIVAASARQRAPARTRSSSSLVTCLLIVLLQGKASGAIARELECRAPAA